MAESWDIKKLLDWSTEYFQDKGIESARLDAELLLAYLLKLKRLDLYLQFERSLNKQELADYKALIKRRVNNEPVAYMIGKKEFWSRDFFVSPAVLVPRPDTEVLVEVVLDEIKKGLGGRDKGLVGFEFGIGSGNIAVTLLMEVQKLSMVAIEASENAIEVARKNMEFHGVMERLALSHAQTLDSISGQFDFIVSNPPYIKHSELKELPETVKNYEPIEALDGGEDGLKYYRVLTGWASGHLNDQGLLAVEIDEDQGATVKRLFKEAGFQNVHIKKDYGGLDRVVFAIMK